MNPVTKIILYIVGAIFLVNFAVYFFFRTLFILVYGGFKFIFGLVFDVFGGLTSMLGLGATTGKWLLVGLIVMGIMGIYKRFTSK